MSKKENLPFLVDEKAKVDWFLKYEHGCVVYKDEILEGKILRQLQIAQIHRHTAIVCVFGERGSGKSDILDALIRRIACKKDVSIFTTRSNPPADRLDELVLATTAVIIPESVIEGIGILFIDVRSWTESSASYLKMMKLADKFATVKLISQLKSLSPELSKLASQDETILLNKEDVMWNGKRVTLGRNLYRRIYRRIRSNQYVEHTFYYNLLERLNKICDSENTMRTKVEESQQQQQQRIQPGASALQVTPPEPPSFPPLLNCADGMYQAFKFSYKFYFENVDIYKHHALLSHNTNVACTYDNLEKFHKLLSKSFAPWYYRAQTKINNSVKTIQADFISCILNKADYLNFTVDCSIPQSFAKSLKTDLRNWDFREVGIVLQRWNSYVALHYKFSLQKLHKELQAAADIFAAYECRLVQVLSNDSRLSPQEFRQVTQDIYTSVLAEKSELKSRELRCAISNVCEQIARKASEENTRLFQFESACYLQAVQLAGVKFQQRREEASVGIYLGTKSLFFSIVIHDDDRLIKHEKSLSPYISLSQQRIQMDKDHGDFNVYEILTEPTVPRSPKSLQLGQDSHSITQEMAVVLYMQEAKKLLDDLCDKDVSFACVSIPQMISCAAKTAVKQSLQIAGFTDVELVPYTMAMVMDVVERKPYLVGNVTSIYNSTTVFEISQIAIDPSRGLIAEKTYRTNVVTSECVSKCLSVVNELWSRPQSVLIEEEDGGCPKTSCRIKQFGYEHSLGTVDSIRPTDSTFAIAQYAELKRQKLTTIAIQHDCSIVETETSKTSEWDGEVLLENVRRFRSVFKKLENTIQGEEAPPLLSGERSGG